MKKVFGRLNNEGNIDVFDAETGEAVTRMDADIYPVNSDLSVRYEHPEGITIKISDAIRYGITFKE